MDTLRILSNEELGRCPQGFRRYLYEQINWNARLIAILGSRGVGKSTMMVQHMQAQGLGEKSLYVSADNVYFAQHSLLDLARQFFQSGGLRLYIDEVHRYPGWSTEIKNIYDTIPGLQVVFSGSSILDLERGGADLSRRCLKYHLAGLSLREYINFTQRTSLPQVTLDQLVTEGVRLPHDMRPLPLYNQYVKEGYYPYFIEGDYAMRCMAAMNATLEVDIPAFAQLNYAVVPRLKRLLYMIAQSVPFKPNLKRLSEYTSIRRDDIGYTLEMMNKAGVISSVWTEASGMSIMAKPDKIYLNNTTLAYLLSQQTPEVGNVRETFFQQSTRVCYQPLASGKSDFCIGQYTFETGGKGKTGKQVKDIPNSYIVKDDFETKGGRTIPLWQFGFLY